MAICTAGASVSSHCCVPWADDARRLAAAAPAPEGPGSGASAVKSSTRHSGATAPPRRATMSSWSSSARREMLGPNSIKSPASTGHASPNSSNSPSMPELAKPATSRKNCPTCQAGRGCASSPTIGQRAQGGAWGLSEAPAAASAAALAKAAASKGVSPETQCGRAVHNSFTEIVELGDNGSLPAAAKTRSRLGSPAANRRAPPAKDRRNAHSRSAAFPPTPTTPPSDTPPAEDAADGLLGRLPLGIQPAPAARAPALPTPADRAPALPDLIGRAVVGIAPAPPGRAWPALPGRAGRGGASETEAGGVGTGVSIGISCPASNISASGSPACSSTWTKPKGDPDEVASTCTSAETKAAARPITRSRPTMGSNSGVGIRARPSNSVPLHNWRKSRGG
mmetsp:Transcript_129241/g.414324  ORF Transcript_129241/g.414324 Transcript_129241/m.414324 type:complete len:395 (-) Transcript_129241:287-1471(-)